MEGGLNSPSEILEPVGKPQLFKCRKSWFYKMLIWSALGTSEQQGSEQEPPPRQYNPSFILKCRGKWGRTKGKEQGGSVTKGGGGGSEKNRSENLFLFCLHAVLCPPAMFKKKNYFINDREEWTQLNADYHSPLTTYFFSFPMPLTFHFSKSISLHLCIATW